ncbi:guanine nucleotide exchange factor DBS-like [Arapaima gigas]
MNAQVEVEVYLKPVEDGGRFVRICLKEVSSYYKFSQCCHWLHTVPPSPPPSYSPEVSFGLLVCWGFSFTWTQIAGLGCLSSLEVLGKDNKQVSWNGLRGGTGSLQRSVKLDLP